MQAFHLTASRDTRLSYRRKTVAMRAKANRDRPTLGLVIRPHIKGIMNQSGAARPARTWWRGWIFQKSFQGFQDILSNWFHAVLSE